VFGPVDHWEPELLSLASITPTTESLAIEPDAEFTNLPPGMLDSSPSEHNSTRLPTTIQALCDTITTPAPTEILSTPTATSTLLPRIPTPAADTEPPQLTETTSGVVRRRSTRLASRPVTSDKLKKWGINEQNDDKVLMKQKQLLDQYQGPHSDMAADAITDLLGLGARCN
jgi:hypothetical protein